VCVVEMEIRNGKVCLDHTDAMQQAASECLSIGTCTDITCLQQCFQSG
jgi:hypothetical protein